MPAFIDQLAQYMPKEMWRGLVSSDSDYIEDILRAAFACELGLVLGISLGGATGFPSLLKILGCKWSAPREPRILYRPRYTLATREEPDYAALEIGYPVFIEAK